VVLFLNAGIWILRLDVILRAIAKYQCGAEKKVKTGWPGTKDTALQGQRGNTLGEHKIQKQTYSPVRTNKKIHAMYLTWISSS